MINFLLLFHTILLTANAATEPIKYKRNDRIHLAARLNCKGPYTSYSTFFPKLDKLSMLRINVQEKILDDCSLDIYSVDSKVQTRYSFPLTDDDGNVVEFLSLVLYFDKGNNTAMNWDTSFDTNSCKNRKIINKTCAVKYNSIDKYEYIKVFTASVGTDKDNTPLTSAQNLPSTFVKFGVGGVIDDATKFVNKAGDWFNKKF